MPDTGPELARRLGTTDAVVIGLGSMIGAGVSSAFAPAAAAVGAGLMIGLGIAAVVAFCNATASAQLAATYPTPVFRCSGAGGRVPGGGVGLGLVGVSELSSAVDPVDMPGPFLLPQVELLDLAGELWAVRSGTRSRGAPCSRRSSSGRGAAGRPW